jgi:hypothetical protein
MICTCATHCRNRCEIACCGQSPRPCDCWCHVVERRKSPEGNPQRSGEAGTSPESLCPDGLSERSTLGEQATTCTVCGRALHTLEQIRLALEAAPGEALAAGQEQHPSDAYSFALGHLTCAIGDATRGLECHTGHCHEGEMS